jgi:DNA-binding XRE family transcriptional regulator
MIKHRTARASEVWSRPMLLKAIDGERARLGARLQQLRSERGMSHDVAAERCGVSARHLARVEAGTANVTIATLVALAMGYGIPLRDLFD